MNPRNPREELELRMTALLLGELSGDEAAALRQTIAEDAELARLHDRLKFAIELARETSASPQAEAVAKPEPLKLAPERRAKLLASFASPKTIQLVQQRHARRRELLALAAMAIGLLAVAGVLMPTLNRPTARAQRVTSLGGERDFPSFAASEDETRAIVAGEEIQKGGVISVNSVGYVNANVPADKLAITSLPLDGMDGGANNNNNTVARQKPAPSSPRTRQYAADAPVRQEANPRFLPPANQPTAPTRAAPLPSTAQNKEGAESEKLRAYAGRIALPEAEAADHEGAAITRRPEVSDLFADSKLPSVNQFRWAAPSGGGGAGGGGAGGLGGVAARSPALATIPEALLKNTLADHMSREQPPTLVDPATGLPVQGVVNGTIVAGTNIVVAGSTFAYATDGFEKRFGTIADRPAAPGSIGSFDADDGKKSAEKQNFFRMKRAGGSMGVKPSEYPLAEIVLPEVALAVKPRWKDEVGNEIAADAPVVINQIMANPADGVLALNFDSLRQAQEGRALREAAIPKSASVAIVDPAETKPAKSPTMLERIRGTFSGGIERSARISVQKDAPDVSGLSTDRSIAAFDPYWVQTETERIQSKSVLSDVAEKLNLDEAWGGKRGGEKLKAEDTYRRLKGMTTVTTDPKTGLIDIKVKSDKAEEAARIANTIAQVYREQRLNEGRQSARRGLEVLEKKVVEQEQKIAQAEQELERRRKEANSKSDAVISKPAPAAGIPQPEVFTAENPFSTFSLNVSDVSFKLAAASLEKGVMPEPATVRTEEFINAFDYRDAEPAGSAPIAFAWDRARYPFAHDRDLVRFSVKTAASGRQPGRPLNLVLLLDNSGSMERADRLRIRQECLRVLASQLQTNDRVSVVAFARTAQLWVDGLPGAQGGELPQRVGSLAPEGGTNLEEAMNLAYRTAVRHYLAEGVNRVVLLTDGAANLGDVAPESLKQKVEANRRQGIALDCFGIGWEGYNDDLLEVLARNGDGRYGFVNTHEAASSDFAGQLAGALKVAASDVKVQVEFNPRRVTAYRQMGYAKHQLTKEQFRDNTVDAAEIGAAEAGNALYVVQVNPRGEGHLGTVRVRFKIPGTGDYREHEWPVPYEGSAKPLEQSAFSMRLAATAAAFSEWLVSSPYAAEVAPDRLLASLAGVPESCPADPRPKKLEWMIRQARSVAGK